MPNITGIITDDESEYFQLLWETLGTISSSQVDFHQGRIVASFSNPFVPPEASIDAINRELARDNVISGEILSHNDDYEEAVFAEALMYQLDAETNMQWIVYSYRERMWFIPHEGTVSFFELNNLYSAAGIPLFFEWSVFVRFEEDAITEQDIIRMGRAIANSFERHEPPVNGLLNPDVLSESLEYAERTIFEAEDLASIGRFEEALYAALDVINLAEIYAETPFRDFFMPYAERAWELFAALN
jgi:hypothetical protein